MTMELAMASPPSTSSGPVSPGASPDNSNMKNLWDRFEYLKLADEHKNLLIQEVLTKYETLSKQNDELKETYARERMYSDTCAAQAHSLQQATTTLQRLLNADPFILLLIDGDGMIFQSALLREGEEGGKRAAALLHAAVSQWSLGHVKELPSDYKVVCRIYANVKGLADVCTKAKIVDSPAQVESFVRGFTKGRALFDFVDVGFGKDRADGKIGEMFKLHLFDFHCRQIFFGCSHDNGYARLLEEYISNAEIKDRVTLVGGIAFEKELAELPFPTATFESLFRNTNIDASKPDKDLLTDFCPRVSELRATSVAFTPTTRTPSPGGIGTNKAGTSRPWPHKRNDSIASSAQSSDSGTFSYANAASKAATLPLTYARTATSPAVRKVAPVGPVEQEGVRRNNKGQRIDKVLPYDRDAVTILKRKKLCNAHYLRDGGCCHDVKPGRCAHYHEPKLFKADLEVLRVVARESPCKNRTECDDVKCIYGHRCPFPTATQGSLRGRGCLLGEGCRFPEEMHNMDMQVVPTNPLKSNGTA